ncbi:MAG: DNA-binding protein [Ruminococcaceae bacterium]|nr:DNA-binding protein [Oscillospiraceae bacterium]
MFEKDLRIPLLLDVYGELLTERKREMMDYYYNEDYSLAEISEVTGISRQGVRDSVKKTVAELHDLEEKLHMVEKMGAFEACMAKVKAELAEMAESAADGMKPRIANVLKVITETEEEHFPSVE